MNRLHAILLTVFILSTSTAFACLGIHDHIIRTDEVGVNLDNMTYSHSHLKSNTVTVSISDYRTDRVKTDDHVHHRPGYYCEAPGHDPVTSRPIDENATPRPRPVSTRQTPQNAPQGDANNDSVVERTKAPQRSTATRVATRRFILVITEVHIQDGMITTIKGCNSNPNYNLTARLTYGARRTRITVDNEVYQKPVWNRKTESWDETCKTIATEIPVSAVYLLTNGVQGDIFDVELTDGIWLRRYERLNTPTAYPYFNVIDGRTAEAWYQESVPAAPMLRRNTTGTWATLKTRR